MFSAKIAGIIFGPGCPQHPQYILRIHLFNTRYWRREIKAEDWENIPIWFWSTNVNWCLNPLEASPQTSESFFQCSETKQSDKKRHRWHSDHCWFCVSPPRLKQSIFTWHSMKGLLERFFEGLNSLFGRKKFHQLFKQTFPGNLTSNMLELCWIVTKSVHGRFRNTITAFFIQKMFSVFRGLKYDDTKSCMFGQITTTSPGFFLLDY